MKKIKSGLKSIGRAVKKVVKSKAFKIVAAAALIYVGGAALGAWNAAGPLASVNGTLAGGSGAASAGSAAASNAAAAASMPTGIETLTVTAPAATGGASGVIAPTIAASAPVLATANPPPASTEFSPVEQPAAPKTGVISRMMEGTAKAATKAYEFADKHPFVASSMVSGIASALSPDEMDLLREQQRLKQKEEDEARKRRDANLNIGAINLGMRASSEPLKYLSSGQNVYQNGVLGRLNRSA